MDEIKVNTHVLDLPLQLIELKNDLGYAQVGQI